MNIKITVVFLRSWQFWHPLSRDVHSYKLPFKQSDSKSYYKATVIKTVVLVRDRHKSMQQNRKPSHFGKQLGSSFRKKKKTYIQLPYNTTIIVLGNYLRKMKIYMYTNYYKQIWSKQFYFQLWKTEISPYVFHRWI